MSHWPIVLDVSEFDKEAWFSVPGWPEFVCGVPFQIKYVAVLQTDLLHLEALVFDWYEENKDQNRMLVWKSNNNNYFHRYVFPEEGSDLVMEMKLRFGDMVEEHK